MVALVSLWAPILLAAVLVFVASSIVHMVLGYHRADYKRLPREDEILDALRGFDVPPGDYLMPCPTGPGAMKDPEFIAKRRRGPVALMTFMSGDFDMGKSLLQYFVYCVVVSVFAAYVGSRALMPGADYLDVFRFTGTVAFVGYTLALAQASIWYRRSWATTLRLTFDGLIYGLLTGGAFGWLWPR